MKILQISPQFPYPLDSGGKIGIYNITKVLYENGADITLVAFSRFPIPEFYLKEVSKICKVNVILQPNQNSTLRAFYNFVNFKPALPNKFFTRSVLAKLESIIHKQEYDLIHIDHSSLMKVGIWLKQRIGRPLGLRLHNIEWIIWYRYYNDIKRFSPLWWFYKQQYPLLKDFEKFAISNADISFTCTDEDRKKTLELVPDANVVVVTPGVDLDFWTCKNTILRNPKEIVYATTFQWKANVDGIFWFLDNVFPYVRKKHPDVILSIIGKNPPYALSKYKNVKVVGWVDNVQPYYNRANISICPLFVGGGIRIKILEAMSMELPVVSTSIGAEGIDAIETDGLFIADKPELFAEIVGDLLSDFQLARTLGKNARAYIEQKHSTKESFKKVFNYYKRITED
ncbi:MAG: glycosyltransferase family 4 protein [Candidatus Kapaibacteriales bacterium]